MGKDFTIRHYRRKLQKKADEFNKPVPLVDYLRPLMDSREYVSVLDVGSGPFLTIGSVMEGVDIHVTACDFLADEFNAMMLEAGIVPHITIEKQDMEHLTYRDNSFDIVHCANALDHTESPYLALEEMTRVCRIGGYVYLRHFENVGERNRYKGLHQWNISMDGNDALFWNKETSFHLNDIMPLARTEREGRQIVSVCHI